MDYTKFIIYIKNWIKYKGIYLTKIKMDYYNFTRLLYNITKDMCYINLNQPCYIDQKSLYNISPYLMNILEYCLYILFVVYSCLSYNIYVQKNKIKKLKQETLNIFLEIEIIKTNLEIITLSQKKYVSNFDSDKLEIYIKEKYSLVN